MWSEWPCLPARPHRRKARITLARRCAPGPAAAGVRVTKTSIMLGCGETPDEVVATLKTLRCAHAPCLPAAAAAACLLVGGP